MVDRPRCVQEVPKQQPIELGASCIKVRNGSSPPNCQAGDLPV